MNGSKRIASISKSIKSNNPMTWLPIYYSFKENAVITETDYILLKDQGGFYQVTTLINPNTEQQIIGTINNWKKS